MIVLSNDNRHYILDLIKNSNNLVIACLCAAWCDTCNGYKSEFDSLAAQMPQHLFIWIDIEDYPEYLGDVDIENFPTILVQNQNTTLFFGEQMPYKLHLKRLIESIESKSIPSVSGETPPMISGVIAVND